jgi:hypothetical protein
MAQLTKAEFDIQTAVLFPTNGVGAISALDLRTQINNLADSVPFKSTERTTAPDVNDDIDNNGGNGAVEIGDVWIDETNDQAYICVDNTAFNAVWLGITSGGLGSAVVPYDLHYRFTSSPTSSQYIGKIMILREVTIGADMVGSIGIVETNPSSTYTMDLVVYDPESPSVIGNVVIDTDGAFTFTTVDNNSYLLSSGTLLGLRAPGVINAAIANMTLAIAGSTPSL